MVSSRRYAEPLSINRVDDRIVWIPANAEGVKNDLFSYSAKLAECSDKQGCRNQLAASARSRQVHLGTTKIQPIGVHGGTRISEVDNEEPYGDRLGCSCARNLQYARDHEQRLQK